MTPASRSAAPEDASSEPAADRSRTDGTESPARQLQASVAERVAVQPNTSPDRRRPVQHKGQTSQTATALLGVEREARRAESEAELSYLMVNGSRTAVAYRHAMLLMRAGPKKHRMVAASSLSAIDRNSTLVRWIEALAERKLEGEALAKIVTFDARRESASDEIDASSYPFPRMALVPLKLRDETVFGHLLLAREDNWDEPSLVAVARLCEAYSHAWEALSGPAKVRRRLRSRTAIAGGIAAAAFLAGFLPVPLTVLAPAEVSAARPAVVAAPMDGVVETVHVEPNSPVKAGTPLFSFSDVDLRNRLELAGQAVGVAEARYTQFVRTSFADARAKRDLAIAESELALKRAEYDYASELMGNATVRAGADGLVVFSSRDDWTGRPVSTGERIMRIADPSKVDLTVHLPVGDAIVMEDGARVRLYLDADPLSPVEAELTSASFHAAPDDAGVLSYRVRARFGAGEDAPRIGLRGTAQIYGERVTLFYYLLRKPLAAIRQWTGF